MAKLESRKSCRFHRFVGKCPMAMYICCERNFDAEVHTAKDVSELETEEVLYRAFERKGEPC